MKKKKEIRNVQKDCDMFEPIKKDNTCKYKIFMGSEYLDNYSFINTWNCKKGGGKCRCPYYWIITRY